MIGRRITRLRRGGRLAGDRSLLPGRKLRLWVGPFADPEFYLNSGSETLRSIKAFGGLESHASMLEVGCGCGRIARALTRYLRRGSYEGFDVSPQVVQWCAQHITPRYRNFHFRRVDVRNGAYNPSGTIKVSRFHFPYEDETFDFVLAESVFTHMLTAESERFLQEIGRVLSVDGRCRLTFFLLTGESTGNIAAHKTLMTFKPFSPGTWVWDTRHPEAAVAYKQSRVERALKKSGLRPDLIQFGYWSSCATVPAAVSRDGRPYQDIVLAKKAN
jgi:SAM-dependent methyltransferase